MNESIFRDSFKNLSLSELMEKKAFYDKELQGDLSPMSRAANRLGLQVVEDLIEQKNAQQQ